MTWQHYEDIDVRSAEQIPIKRRYSVTADVLSHQLCPRQYGYFRVREYEPAHTVQLFFGTIIHQVLDMAHAHFRGEFDPNKRDQIPTDSEIENYYLEVERALRARGIRAINRSLRELALNLIQRFNRIEGPILYPRVRDTEHRLQADQGDFVLHGVVDVLASSQTDAQDWDQLEIWDYKGMRKPTENNQQDAHKLQRMKFQMFVYAELYRNRNGVYPSKGIIYFLNELDPEPTTRPDDALFEVEFERNQIRNALQNFSDTVTQIERNEETDSWPAPLISPGRETCDICDIRWSCPLMSSQYPKRYP